MITIKTIKKILATTLAAFALLVVPMLAVSSASALEINKCLIDGTELQGDLSGDCKGSQGGGANDADLTNIIALIVNVISLIVGVVAVVMIIFGGMKYITSGGESNKITSAKNTIMYALIGLIVVAFAQFIVRFVLQKAATVN